MLTIAVAALGGTVGVLVSTLAARLGPAGPLLEALVLTCAFSIRGLVSGARSVAGHLAHEIWRRHGTPWATTW